MEILMRLNPRQLEILTGVMMEHMIFLEDEGLVDNDTPELRKQYEETKELCKLLEDAL
jgi:hypothetical protein